MYATVLLLHLLAATGICVVPLSTGFNSDLQGFRFTLLEADETKFEAVLTDLAAALRAYLASGHAALDAAARPSVTAA